jgi:glucose/arabinose dehydrogenase
MRSACTSGGFAAGKAPGIATMRLTVCALLLVAAPSLGARPPLERIRLPEGFAISLYAEVPNARSMALGDHEIVYVGTRTGDVYAVLPGNPVNGIHKALRIAHGLHSPNGVAVRGGALFVAEVSRVLRYDAIASHLEDPPDPVVVRDDFPRDEHHGWKFIRFGPDGLLYVPVGAPCNVCERDDPRYASIMRMRPDGTRLERFASGVRNTVGFDWNPATNELWFTDNGRDLLGDDIPPDELNRAPRAGLDFGFPYVFGRNRPDPEYGSRAGARTFTPAEWELPAHVAALGMRFYAGTAFPPTYRGRIFIAEHGSWNRSTPIGYRVSVVRVDGNRAAGYEVFADGWLRQGTAWGRPVDVQAMPDGSLLVSDDKAGWLYRIQYGGR